MRQVMSCPLRDTAEDEEFHQRGCVQKPFFDPPGDDPGSTTGLGTSDEEGDQAS